MAPGNAKRFDQKNLEKLEQSDAQQKQFHKKIIETRKFSAEQPALSITSKEAFENFWGKARGSKAEYDRKHDNGAGRVSRGAISLAASANGILRDVSPILDLVRDFGAPYGGMAIGTICFVFVVAENRARMEEQITTTFASIRDRLPGIRVYQHIYNDDHELDGALQSKILDAYDSFIGFCMAAFEFYTQGSSRRWMQALQSNTALDEQGSRVKKALVDVRLVCEDLLNKNVDTVKTKVDDLRAINSGLSTAGWRTRGQLSELQENKDEEYVEKIARLLGLWPFSDDKRHIDVARHREDVAAEFSQKNLRSRTTVKEQQSTVVNSQAYQHRLTSPQSGVLILSGVNEYDGAHHCWVSPVALDLIDKTTNLEGQLCLFYLLGLRKEEDTWVHVLTFLVYRLLQANKKALRNEALCQGIWADLQSYAHLRELPNDVDHRTHRTLEKLESVALRALGLLDSETKVWIVLDRVDNCRPMPGPRAHLNRKAGRFLLEAMTHLVERASMTVKVLAVVNRADWNVDQLKGELGEEREGSVVIKTCRESGDDDW